MQRLFGLALEQNWQKQKETALARETIRKILVKSDIVATHFESFCRATETPSCLRSIKMFFFPKEEISP